MKSDIFIPTTGNINILQTCLQSLALQKNKNFRILLVSTVQNKSLDRLQREFPILDMKIIIQQKSGLVAAANQALKLSMHDIFIRIDDDVVVDPNWHAAIIDMLYSQHEIAAVTGPTLIPKLLLQNRDLMSTLLDLKSSKNPLKQFLWKIYNNFLYEDRMFDVSTFLKSGVFTVGSNFPEAFKTPMHEVNNIEACNFAIKTSVLKKLGGFDEIFAKGLGDYHEADMAFRLQKAGYKIVYNPQVKLEHRVSNSKAIRADAYNRIKNFIVFYKRHFGILKKNHLFPFIVNVLMQNAYYVMKFVQTGDLHQLGALAGTVDGLLTNDHNKEFLTII